MILLLWTDAQHSKEKADMVGSHSKVMYETRRQKRLSLTSILELKLRNINKNKENIKTNLFIAFHRLNFATTNSGMFISILETVHFIFP